jgi:hypothetical protein
LPSFVFELEWLGNYCNINYPFSEPVKIVELSSDILGKGAGVLDTTSAGFIPTGAHRQLQAGYGALKTCVVDS